MSALAGGTASCTAQLMDALTRAGAPVELLTVDTTADGAQMLGTGSQWLRTVPYDYRTPLCLSSNITYALAESDADLMHTNGLWMWCNHATCAEARRRGIPYVITPHGMLYPEAMARSKWKKRPLWAMWFHKDVMRASAIHVTCEAEEKHVRNLGYRGPIAVIGNPVEILPAVDDIFNHRTAAPVIEGKHPKKIGFLGRLHPRKKGEALLYGVALRPEAEVEIVFMGSGSPEYETFLRSEAHRLGIADRVEFAGFVSGEEKFRRLAELSALFVPSDMENFGMIVPEALLVGTPVMASLGTPWQSLNDTRSGWWTSNEPESIARVIDEICATTPYELLAMGTRGREMVMKEFEASHVALRMMNLYDWLLNRADKPAFVHTL